MRPDSADERFKATVMLALSEGGGRSDQAAHGVGGGRVRRHPATHKHRLRFRETDRRASALGAGGEDPPRESNPRVLANGDATRYSAFVR